MQLFITKEFDVKNDKIVIKEKRIFDQLRKVLRAKNWYQFAIQDERKRYYVVFESFYWWMINWLINNEENLKYKFRNIWIATAFLNKQDKMELICQKLTELWIERIIFFSSDRSVIKKVNQNKLNRMNKIILEAAEQAWLPFVPKLEVYKDLSEFVQSNSQLNFYVADFDWEEVSCKIKQDNLMVLIWPEGGWTEKERKFFNEKKFKKIKLWNTILRSETAAIILGWIVS